MKKKENLVGGTVDTDGNIKCGNCGRKDKFKGTSFIDGKDFYINTYTCECGNLVTISGKRDKKDQW